MKNYISTLFILILAALFMWASTAIKRQPDSVLGFVEILKGKCAQGSLRCKVIAPIVKDAETITHGINRLDVSKDQLPVMRIYMTDGSIGKLEAKRRSNRAIEVT